MHFSAPRLCYHLLRVFFTNSTIRLFGQLQEHLPSSGSNRRSVSCRVCDDQHGDLCAFVVHVRRLTITWSVSIFPRERAGRG